MAKDGVLHGMARILEPPRPVRLRSRWEARFCMLQTVSLIADKFTLQKNWLWSFQVNLLTRHYKSLDFKLTTLSLTSEYHYETTCLPYRKRENKQADEEGKVIVIVWTSLNKSNFLVWQFVSWFVSTDSIQLTHSPSL